MEYSDSKILIFVKNLPLFITEGENPLILKSIRTIKGIQDIELYEGINLIELSLSEIIDFLIKKSLHDPKIKDLGIDYYILGGKAINNIIKLKYIKKSFDFDIHVKNPKDIINISKYITDYCNSELNKSYNKMLRYQIYKKLLLLNLVDSNLKDYYFHNNLIFYGNRINRTNPANQISGLFIKLKLRKNLFKYDKIDIKYSNFLLNTELNANDLRRTIGVNNILYIPIADIDLDNVVTFGINVYNTSSSIYRNPFENINYADFSIILFNLLKCIVKVPNKIESNGKKLNNFIKSLYYNCNIYNEYNSLNKFNTMYRKIIKSLKKYKDVIIYDDCFPSRCQKLHQFINDNNVSDLSRITTYGSFIEKLVNKIINTKEFYRQNCKVLLGEGSVLNETNIFNDVINNKEFLLRNAVNILADLDQVNGSYFFLQYTGVLYRNLNIYCNYLNNNVSTDSLYPYEFNNKQFEYSIIGREISFNNGTINYDDVITNMNNIYELYHSDVNLIQIKLALKENFYIYSSQLITNFTQMDLLANRSFIDLSYIKAGDIIQISQYLSGTFNTEFDFSEFDQNSSSNRIFLKIKINKNNKNWIIIDKYSFSSQESEILLKQNSIFFIEKIDYEVVKIDGKKKEYKVITLQICDDNKFDLIIKKVLGSCGFNDFDNILKTPLFIKSLKYVYDIYFKRPYKESYCRHLAIEDAMTIRINENGQSITELIYKYNHALAHTVRIACWIQLLYLQDRLYNKISNTKFDHKFLMRTCIASIFMISGRESEAGVSTDFTPDDLKRDCPEIRPDPYQRYLIQSANNFYNYVNLPEIRELLLFNQEDKDDYKYCLQHYYYIYRDLDTGSFIPNDSENRKVKRKKIATYFSIAHGNDLIRCHEEAYVGTMLHKSHPSYKKEIKINAQLMCDIMTNTGDRIYSNRLQHGEIKDPNTNLPYVEGLTTKNYNKFLFYLCSTNPEYCITSVLNTTDEYFNQLIYDLEEYKFFKDKQQTTTFNLDTLISYDPDDIIDEVDEDEDDKIDEDKDDEVDEDKDDKVDEDGDDSIKQKPTSMPTSKPTNRRRNKSKSKTAFIFDDNSNDVESINLQVNNSNLGSTYYMSSQSYDKLTKENSLFLINGIYFQNIYTSFNKSIDICNEQIIYKLRIGQVRIYEYEKKVYPQYFINIDTRTTEEDLKYLRGIKEDKELKNIAKQIAATQPTEEQTSGLLILKQTDDNVINKLSMNNPDVSTIYTIPNDDNISKIQSSKKNTNQEDDPVSVMDFKSKYLKYKKKYIELKNKLNL